MDKSTQAKLLSGGGVEESLVPSAPTAPMPGMSIRGQVLRGANRDGPWGLPLSLIGRQLLTLNVASLLFFGLSCLQQLVLCSRHLFVIDVGNPDDWPRRLERSCCNPSPEDSVYQISHFPAFGQLPIAIRLAHGSSHSNWFRLLGASSAWERTVPLWNDSPSPSPSEGVTFTDEVVIFTLPGRRSQMAWWQGPSFVAAGGLSKRMHSGGGSRAVAA